MERRKNRMIVAYIDGKRVVFTPEETTQYGYGELIETEDGEEYYIFEDRDQAGEAAREYWEDLAQDDPHEFAYLVGEETLIQWGLGNYAGPGSTQVQNLQEWLDLWLDTPEEQFASYDSQEREFKCKHPDWAGYTVAYRHN
jgi:hypothetical protein